MMNNFKGPIIILAFCFFLVSADSVFINVFERVKRDIPDECKLRPLNPDQPPPVCCPIMPHFLGNLERSFDSCHEAFHKNHKSDISHHKRVFRRFAEPFAGDRHHPPGDAPINHEIKRCMMECVFNASGYLTADGMLNEDILNQKVNDEVLKDSRWAPLGQTMYTKCISSAKEANAQVKDGCKPGAAEYMKCMAREAFSNCPSEIWVTKKLGTCGEVCNDIKKKMEKCPNLPPPMNHNRRGPPPPKH